VWHAARRVECDRIALRFPILGLYGEYYGEKIIAGEAALQEQQEGTEGIKPVNLTASIAPTVRASMRLLPYRPTRGRDCARSPASAPRRAESTLPSARLSCVAQSTWFEGVDKTRMFPPSFKLILPKGERKAELFGDLIARMERRQQHVLINHGKPAKGASIEPAGGSHGGEQDDRKLSLASIHLSDERLAV
jgi:hypothetical protein